MMSVQDAVKQLDLKGEQKLKAAPILKADAAKHERRAKVLEELKTAGFDTENRTHVSDLFMESLLREEKVEARKELIADFAFLAEIFNRKYGEPGKKILVRIDDVVYNDETSVRMRDDSRYCVMSGVVTRKSGRKTKYVPVAGICNKLLKQCRRRLPEGAVWFVDTKLPVDTRLTAR